MRRERDAVSKCNRLLEITNPLTASLSFSFYSHCLGEGRSIAYGGFMVKVPDSVKECDEIVYISRPSVKVIISPHTVCSSEKSCHRFLPRLMSFRLLVDASAEHRR